MLVAVYGSLRGGLHNSSLLKGTKSVGTFETEPSYTLVDLGLFPGLIKEGGTSVVMEVYEVDESKLERLDNLEGYRGDADKSANFYNRETITTPYGEAFTYFYGRSNANSLPIVESGDWKDYYKIKNLIN